MFNKQRGYVSRNVGIQYEKKCTQPRIHLGALTIHDGLESFLHKKIQLGKKMLIGEIYEFFLAV
jgi:hypothetical protein